MAERTTSARPYAKAVFEIARQHDDLAGWAELLGAAAMIVSHEDVHKLLHSPHATADQLADFIVGILHDCKGVEGASVEELADNLLRVLAHNYRLDLLPEICAIFEHLKAEVENIVEVQVTSAAPVGPKQQEQIGAALEKRFGRQVQLSFDIDESLIGGAVLRADDLVIDGSLRGRLQKLATAMTH